MNHPYADEIAELWAASRRATLEYYRHPFSGLKDSDARTKSTGLCHECDRPVTGTRRICGTCVADRWGKQ